MKRLSIWIVSTATGVVLLFSYSTSTSGPGGSRVVAGVAPVGIVDEPPTAAPSAPTVVGPTAVPSVSAPAPSAPKAVAQRPPAVVSTPGRRVATPAPQPSPSPVPKKTTAAATTRTINGAPADTRYGPVQVQIKVRGGRIVSSDAIVYPTSERRDREINDYAVPQLNDETVQAQSANIDTVSGATYTSDGYRQSLQSALDAAHL